MTGTVRLTVQSIAAGGDGVARAEGLAVFIPRTAPGDVADVRVRRRARFGRGALAHLVVPSADRVAPRCRHYDGDRCGGCQLQHIAYPAQLEAKRRIVRDALVRIGGRQVDLPPIVESPRAWEYRSRLALAIRRNNLGWRAGLHVLEEPDVIFDLTECPITQPDVLATWRTVRQAAAFLPASDELRGEVRCSDTGCSLEVAGGSDWTTVARFADACPDLAWVRWLPAGGSPRIVLDRRAAQEPLGAFRQVNRAVGELLHAAVVERATVGAPGVIVDAYAGTGTTAEALSARGARVTAIELDVDAAQAAAASLTPPSRAVQARVEDALAAHLPADLVILNPPRTGVHAHVTGMLEARPVPRVLYVSCDPATLARDVRRLPGYAITHLQLFDMFPQTAHVESLCELTRTAA